MLTNTRALLMSTACRTKGGLFFANLYHNIRVCYEVLAIWACQTLILASDISISGGNWYDRHCQFIFRYGHWLNGAGKITAFCLCLVSDCLSIPVLRHNNLPLLPRLVVSRFESGSASPNEWWAEKQRPDIGNWLNHWDFVHLFIIHLFWGLGSSRLAQVLVKLWDRDAV